MQNISRKVIITGLFWVASISVLYGYKDANVWRCAVDGIQDIYTVPAGQSFWLYGMLFNAGSSNSRLRVDGSPFWCARAGCDTWSHQFTTPILFPSGTVFSVECFQSYVMIYGYEGTSNPVYEDGAQKHNVTMNQNTQIYPTPFSKYTTINYQVPKKDKVNISVYDEVGRLVNVIVDEMMFTGTYTARWDGKDNEGNAVADGSYFCVVKTNGTSNTKVIYIK